MPKENEIKAIFSLLESEPSHREQLLKSLADFYKQNPQQVYILAKEYYGVLPHYLKEIFQTNKNNFKEEINHFLNLKNPDLLESLVLLARIIDPQNTKEQSLELFDLAREDFDKVMDSSFDIRCPVRLEL